VGRKSLNNETVAILVFGACENHGDHLPFGSDVFVPMETTNILYIFITNILACKYHVPPVTLMCAYFHENEKSLCYIFA
jgi:hypothetical protein